jgi:hypothetical protein
MKHLSQLEAEHVAGGEIWILNPPPPVPPPPPVANPNPLYPPDFTQDK